MTDQWAASVVTPDTIARLKEATGMGWETLAGRVGVSTMTLYRMRKGQSDGLPIVRNRLADLMAEAGVVPYGGQRSGIVRAEDV